MRSTISFLSLLLAATSTLAVAVDEPQCKYSGNQQEMNACAVRDYKTADSLLNKRYKVIMSSLPNSKQEILRSQQRNWLKKRDPQCQAEAKDSEGGSIWPLEYYGCLKLSTEQRTKELEAWRVK